MKNIQQVKEIKISSKGVFEKFLNDFKDSNFFGKLGVILNAKDELGEYFKRFALLYFFIPFLGVLSIIIAFLCLEDLGAFVIFLLGGIGMLVLFYIFRKKLLSELRGDEKAYYLFNGNGIIIEKPYAEKPHEEIPWEKVGYICWLEDVCVFIDKEKNLLFTMNPEKYTYSKEEIGSALALASQQVQEMPYDEYKKLPWARKQLIRVIIYIIIAILLAILKVYMD